MKPSRRPLVGAPLTNGNAGVLANIYFLARSQNDWETVLVAERCDARLRRAARDVDALGVAWPETPLPLIGASQQFIDGGETQTAMDKTWQEWLAQDETEQNWLARNMPTGAVTPAFYNSLFTMHATIMIFFVVTPFLVGGFGNFLIPLMIGAGDMAFPLLNMFSFWFTLPAAVLVLYSFFVPGGAAAGGWTMYATLSAKAQYSGVESGVDLWILSLILLSVASLMGSINYITTIINMRAPGMTWFRLPLTIWSLFVTAVLLLLALPVLTAALLLLLFDRTMGTSFFLPEGGGEPLLWQHLFWFFGHPEVYILVLPAMGVTSEILSTFSRKPIFGYHAMVLSMIALALLSWVVWGHHMFTWHEPRPWHCVHAHNDGHCRSVCD